MLQAMDSWQAGGVACSGHRRAGRVRQLRRRRAVDPIIGRQRADQALPREGPEGGEACAGKRVQRGGCDNALAGLSAYFLLQFPT
eukprot:CAMPEP_0115839198 /NCGR_PEP_ID=MMETSP0287-20121206/6128_1 /TAXON_ID=412157 /ORGANISM="Chrysochromulina rotalis, Strain UIO044" /LENGTH=84 /DNA_ID=CAMNT_0003292763 /DNA_START=294 /DNA_END=548 /DNA_ORIENTATION=+